MGLGLDPACQYNQKDVSRGGGGRTRPHLPVYLE